MKLIVLFMGVVLNSAPMNRQELRSLYKDDEYHWIAATDTQLSICGICRESDQKLKSLSCHPTHTFHPACINEWAKQKSECPVCRAPITDSLFCTCIKSIAKPGVCVPGMMCVSVVLANTIPRGITYLQLIDSVPQTIREHLAGSSCLCLSCVAAFIIGPCAYGIKNLKRD